LPQGRRGEIVVVMVEGEATVKRIFPEGERIRLQPANATMRPEKYFTATILTYMLIQVQSH